MDFFLLTPYNPKEPAMIVEVDTAAEVRAADKAAKALKATAALTKDQASDLKSHTDRLVQTALALRNAQNDHDQAQRNLDQFVYDLQHPKQGA